MIKGDGTNKLVAKRTPTKKSQSKTIKVFMHSKALTDQLGDQMKNVTSKT